MRRVAAGVPASLVEKLLQPRLLFWRRPLLSCGRPFLLDDATSPREMPPSPSKGEAADPAGKKNILIFT